MKGSLDMVLVAEHGEEFELIASGESMTDASKRRLTSPPEKELIASGADDEKALSESSFSFGKKLPAGIRVVERWGKTVLQVGKYEKAGLCYDQISSSDRKEHSEGRSLRSTALTSLLPSRTSSAISMSRTSPKRLERHASMAAQFVEREPKNV